MNTIAYLKIPAITSRFICPVSSSMVNERIARFNGALTVLILLVFIFTQSIIPILVLVVDFSLRAFKLPKFSPFSFVAEYLSKIFNAAPKMINAGPKIFASRIGLIFSGMITASILMNSVNSAYVLSAILGTFSFLEAVFGICVACEIYPRVYRLLY